MRPDWRQIWLDRLEAEPWLAPRRAGLQERSDDRTHRVIGLDGAQIRVPIQLWGGWADND